MEGVIEENDIYFSYSYDIGNKVKYSSGKNYIIAEILDFYKDFTNIEGFLIKVLETNLPNYAKDEEYKFIISRFWSLYVDPFEEIITGLDKLIKLKS